MSVVICQELPRTADPVAMFTRKAFEGPIWRSKRTTRMGCTVQGDLS
jgi:hypothetical protein